MSATHKVEELDRKLSSMYESFTASQNMCNAKDREIQIMEDKLRSLEETTHDVVGRKDSLIVKCQQESMQLKKVNEDAYDQMKQNLESQLSLAKAQLDDAQTNFNVSLRSKEDQLDFLKERLQVLQNANSNLKHENEQNGTTFDSTEVSLRKELGRLEEDNRKLRAEIKEVEMVVDMKERSVNELSEQLARVEGREKALKEQCEIQNKELCDVKVQLASYKTEKQYLEKSLAELNESSKADIQEYNTSFLDSISQLREAISVKENEEQKEDEKSMKALFNELWEENAKLRSKLNDKDTKLSSISEELSEIKLQSPRFNPGFHAPSNAVSVSDISAIMESKDQKAKEIQEHVSEINRLKFQLEDKQTRLQEKDRELRKQEKGYEKELKLQQDKLNAIEHQQEVVKREYDGELQKVREKVEAIQQQLRNSELLITEFRTKNERLEKDIAYQQSEFTRQTQELRNSHMDKLASLSETFKRQTSEKEREILYLKDHFETSEKEKVELNMKVQEVQSQTSTQVMELHTTISSLKNELSHQINHSKNLEKTNAKLQQQSALPVDIGGLTLKESNSLEKKVDSLERKLEKAIEDKQRLEMHRNEALTNLNEEKKTFKDELLRLEGRSENERHSLKTEYTTQIQSLNSEIMRLKEQVTKETTEKQDLKISYREIQGKFDVTRDNLNTVKNELNSQKLNFRYEVKSLEDKNKRLKEELTREQKAQEASNTEHYRVVSEEKSLSNTLKKDLDSLKKDFENVKHGQKKEMENLELENSCLRQELRDISKSTEEQKAVTEKVLQDEVALLKDQLSVVNKNFLAAEEYISGLQKSHGNTLSSLYEKHQKAINKMQLQLQASQAKQAEEGQHEIHRVKLQLTRSKAECKQYSKVAQDALHETEKQKIALESQKMSFSEEKLRLNEEVKDIQKRLEEAENQRKLFKDENENFETKPSVSLKGGLR